MRYIAVLIGSIISVAWAFWPADKCPLIFPHDLIYMASAAPSDRRVYLFPGLDVNVSADFGSGPLKELVDRLRATADVVLLPLPSPKACMFADGGERYRAAFVAAVSSAVASVDAAHHRARENIVGGVSYGGMHAMMAAASTGLFAGWFAHVPVTRMDALTEFPGVGDVPRFNPYFYIPSLKDTAGLVTWGTLDTRVNWQLVKTLALSFGPSVNKIEYPGQDHSTNAQNVADITGWVATR